MKKTGSNHRPLILVTNDDGVDAKGIKALVDVVRPFGDVLVVASNSPMSGMSHAITVKYPLFLKSVHEEEGLQIFESNGTPADCVKLAIEAYLNRLPDFLVSGINHGSNSSVSTHYSGTMGGAREGAIHGIPSIAFSLLNYYPDADFTYAKTYCREIFSMVLQNGMSKGICYNVNIPDGDNIKGIKVCRQAMGSWVEKFEKRLNPRGQAYYWLTGYYENYEPEAQDTDEWALANGYVSVVPCTIDATHREEIDKLKSSGFEKISQDIIT